MKSSPPKISKRTIEQLCDSVRSNPVTIVVGPTTQVPQILVDQLGGRILSTQPRRLAVVAVSSRVAKERGVLLGGSEVGYHVGQSKKAMSCTQLLFVTAGLFLEHLCSYGVKELLKYEAILIDECHERSPESDLVLTIIRSFLIRYAASKPIRIVLMSATFDHARYKQYFKSVVPGCDHIATINLETAASFEAFHDSVRINYLDDIFQRIPYLASRHEEFRRINKINPDEELMGDDAGKSLSKRLVEFVLDLVHGLHQEQDLFMNCIRNKRRQTQVEFFLFSLPLTDIWSNSIRS